MLLLLYLACLLVVSNAQATDVYINYNEDAEATHSEPEYGPNMFWKTIFKTYYDIKGLRNETTDKLVEDFFEHSFEAYPKELYPAFKQILLHISKSNDRIWNFYESILNLYRNVDAADRIYETILRRFDQGTLLTESGELDLNETFPLEEAFGSEYSNLKRRYGVLDEESTEDFEPCEECGVPPLQVGSIRAIPGVHFPDYNEIPLTTFTCAEKHIPGFYADLETGCQVFHVCYPHRRESFLCPIGTIFNQAILACDYWYSSNCSLAPLYFITGPLTFDEYLKGDKGSFMDDLLGQHSHQETTMATQQPVDHSVNEPEDKVRQPKSPKIKITLPNIDWNLMIKFLPIKSKITQCPDFCDNTPSYPTKSTTVTEPTESSTRSYVTPMSSVPPKKRKYTTTTARPVTTPTVTTMPRKTTTRRPVVTRVPSEKTTTYRPAVTPVPPNEDKFEKTEKSEILLDILKAVKLLTKDAEGFLTEIVEKKHRDVNKKPTVENKFPMEKPKPVPEINPRFVVKPVHPGLLPDLKMEKILMLPPPPPTGGPAFKPEDLIEIFMIVLKTLSHLSQ